MAAETNVRLDGVKILPGQWRNSDEDMWDLVREYCDNDVMALEAVFNHLSDEPMITK